MAMLLAVAVVALAAAAGIGAWLWARTPGAHRPEISLYSHGRFTRVEPYRYCDVLLRYCENPETVGELAVSTRYPVQLSVPEAISRAPWRLRQFYEDTNFTEAAFRPHARLAVTIPTFDRQHGLLTGIVVLLPTLARTASGDLVETSHAEWSVRMAY
jgi:Protein of unknown function (DUF2771)